VKLTKEQLINVTVKSVPVICRLWLNIEAPKFKVATFKSNAVTYVKWSEVKRRRLRVPGFISIELKPLFRLNEIFMIDWVPIKALVSTYVEEIVHLHLGFDKANPHDQEFFNLAMKHPTFITGLRWKEQNVQRVAEFMQTYGEWPEWPDAEDG